MNLFLSGGGSGSKSLILDKKFADLIDKSKPLLYIPIAIDKQKHPYSECIKWISNVFNPLGIKRIEMWTENEIVENLQFNLGRFSGIYVGGGNTFYLLHELKKSEFFSKLKLAAESEIPIYGGSAGAIILGKTILTSSDDNLVNLRDFSGLNLIEGYSVFCHYENNLKDSVLKCIKDSQIKKAIALPEDCGLYVTDKFIEVVGPGSAYLINKNINEIKPGMNVN